MADLPKFLSPVLVTVDERCTYTNSVDGIVDCWSRNERDTALARRGQRPKGGVWPAGFGVVEIEDIPEPAPLPTIYVWRHRDGRLLPWLRVPTDAGPFTLVATITFDEAGTPHREDNQ